MNKYNYDFTELQNAMQKLRGGDYSKTILNKIKYELNKFFKDSLCTEVIYTKNINNLFFGMCTYADIDDVRVQEILTGDKPIRISSYKIEIDSKLLEIGLNTRELVAVLLHEVGHLVNDSTPANEIKKAVDTHMAEIGDQIDLSSLRNAECLFSFAIQDAYRRFTSIFTKNDEEVIADQFVFLCGYGEELQSAFKKIMNASGSINNDSNKLIAFAWTLSVYKNLGMHRNRIIKSLNKMEKLTGSQLQKNKLSATSRILQRARLTESEIDRSCSVVYESIVVKENGNIINEDGSFVGKIQKKGLRGIEEDLYEFSIRIKNAETEDEAMLILRQMNTRMAVLDDYINYNEDISERERKKCESVYERYFKLREELSKKMVYNKKNYGIWFDYNQIDSNR